MSRGLGRAGGDPVLEPALEEPEAVAAFGDLDHLVDGAGLADGHQDLLDQVLVGIELEELANDLGGFGGGYLLLFVVRGLWSLVLVYCLRKKVVELEVVSLLLLSVA